MAAQLMVQIVRRTADFHPTIWGDYFLKYASESTVSIQVLTPIHLETQTKP